MKTDSIFYRLFLEMPGIYFQLIDQSPTMADSYEFRSVEIKQTAFRLDGVLVPKTESAATSGKDARISQDYSFVQVKKPNTRGGNGYVRTR